MKLHYVFEVELDLPPEVALDSMIEIIGDTYKMDYDNAYQIIKDYELDKTKQMKHELEEYYKHKALNKLMERES